MTKVSGQVSKNVMYIGDMGSMLRTEIRRAVKSVAKQKSEIARIQNVLDTTKDSAKRAQWESELTSAKEHPIFTKMSPMMFWGPPGVGKTMGIKWAIKEEIKASGLRIACVTMHASVHDMVSLRGIPVPDREMKQIEFYQVKSLPTDAWCKDFDLVVLFIDELSAADRPVQKPLYRLMQEGAIEDYTLPANVMIVAAGNDKDDRAISNDMSSALANRLWHADVQVDFDAWKSYGIQTGMHPMVIAFHNQHKGDKLYKLNTEQVGTIKAFATPRTWERVSSDLFDYEDADDRIVKQRIVGHVGVEVGTEFHTFFQIHDKMPDPERILNGKESNVPDEDHVKYAVLSSLVSCLVKDHNKERIENFFSYVDKMCLSRKELGYMAVNDLFRSQNREIIRTAMLTKSWSNWADKIIGIMSGN